MIALKEITPENFWDIIELKVHPQQQEWVLPNAVSIAQAKVQPECIPLAIYSDDQPVGFVMYCLDRDDGEYWIYRLMIDARFQGKGYGRRAMEQVVASIRRDGSTRKIYLGVHSDGHAAIRLYESLGFVFNGQVFGGERIMVLNPAL